MRCLMTTSARTPRVVEAPTELETALNGESELSYGFHGSRFARLLHIIGAPSRSHQEISSAAT